LEGWRDAAPKLEFSNLNHAMRLRLIMPLTSNYALSCSRGISRIFVFGTDAVVRYSHHCSGRFKSCSLLYDLFADSGVYHTSQMKSISFVCATFVLIWRRLNCGGESPFDGSTFYSLPEEIHSENDLGLGEICLKKLPSGENSVEISSQKRTTYFRI